MSQELEFAKLDVLGRIDQIQAGMLKQDPMLPMHLAQIHKTLIQFEELVHLLSDDDIRKLIAGQKKHVGAELVKETIKSRARVPKTTVDDL